VAPGGNCIGPDGKPDGASCLASSWSDDYFETIKNFIVQTGFDMIETDGPYEGAKCASTTHSHHLGEADSAWTQCVCMSSSRAEHRCLLEPITHSHAHPLAPACRLRPHVLR